MKSNTETIIKALEILAQEIQSPDGVANAAIAEAAERLRELIAERDALRAQVEGLRGTLIHLNEYWNGDYNEMAMRDFCDLVVQDTAEALAATSEQCLADVRAQAVEEAARLYTHKWHSDEEINQVGIDILRRGVGYIYPAGLTEYANQIRQQAKGE